MPEKRGSRLAPCGTTTLVRGKQKKRGLPTGKRGKRQEGKRQVLGSQKGVIEEGESTWLCWIFLRDNREMFFGFGQKTVPGDLSENRSVKL